MSPEKISFRCQHCRKRLKIDNQYVGQRVTCPNCRHQALVTDPKAEFVQLDVSALSAAVDDDSFNLKDSNPIPEDEGPDMTPMVDVVFQLLIFFMVTAAFSLQKSIQIPTPENDQKAKAKTVQEIEEDDDYIVVRIDRDNTIWVNDSEAPSDQELLAKLREARNNTDGKGPSSLLVLASGEAHHEKVVLALDAGNAVGMENVRLATSDGEDDY